MTDEQVRERRASDQTDTTIRELIMKAEEPKDKALLLTFLKLSESVTLNTEMTLAIKKGQISLEKRYDDHAVADLVRSKQFALGWKVLSPVLVLAQGIAWFAIKNHIDIDAKLDALVDTHEVRIVELKRNQDSMMERNRIQDEVLQEPGKRTWNFLVATRDDGVEYHRLHAMLAWPNSKHAFEINIGWKIDLSDNEVAPWSSIDERLIGSVFRVRPWVSVI